MGFMCYEQNFDLSRLIFQLLAEQHIPAWTTNNCSAPSPRRWEGAHLSPFIQEKNPQINVKMHHLYFYFQLRIIN